MVTPPLRDGQTFERRRGDSQGASTRKLPAREAQRGRVPQGVCHNTTMRPPRALAALPLVAGLIETGCGPEASAGPGAQMHLRETREFQALYAADGKILRLLYDRNGDRRADAVVLLYPGTNKPHRAEIDTDLDGIVDRWEVHDSDGRLLLVGLGPSGTGQPEQWLQAPEKP